MVDKIEMSLDDIIKTTNIGKRRPNARGGAGAATGRSASAGSRPRGGNQQNGGRAGGGRTQGGGVAKSRNSGGRPSNVTSPRGGGQRFARGDVNSAWKHDMFEGGKKVLRTSGALAGGQQAGSAKLLVSNLDYGVSESDIHELFADFGPLKNASVHYDRSGRSLGTADVVFERRADAVKAMKQYNGVPLDGRPMNIQLAISELPAPIAPPRPRPVGGNGGGRPQPQQKRRGPPAGGRAAGGGGGGATRGGRQNGRTPNPSKTAEELDAELDAYVNDMKL